MSSINFAKKQGYDEQGTQHYPFAIVKLGKILTFQIIFEEKCMLNF